MSGLDAAPGRPVALAVFVAIFGLSVVLGCTVRWWRGWLPSRGGPQAASPEGADGAEEWSLGGRRFGAWVTWFLVGGDFYTAYTVIAVPALVYATGAYGFFALPYTVIVYPFVYLVMPRLWTIARANGFSTAADFVRGQFGSRTLEVAIALSGLCAMVPYIALQLVGIRSVLEILGLSGIFPLTTAFVALAVYTWAGGLHAPALTAVIKDVMIYVVVLAAVIVIPAHLGGYGHVFAAVSPGTVSATGHVLPAGTGMAYATLALSSALAAFLYPHTLTGVLASRSADTIRANAIYLPVYTVALGLIAVLGLMARAAGISTPQTTQIVPLLFWHLFPSWFAGFCFAAIAVGALVPAAVMAIGGANLVTRNIVPRLGASPYGARGAGFFITLAALLCVVCLNARFAIDLQLLGGLVILQSFPALVLGSFIPWLRAGPLLLGWCAGSLVGIALCFDDGLGPVHVVTLGGHAIGVSTGLLALVCNLLVTAATTPLWRGAARAA